jgi:hypothetical protein
MSDNEPLEESVHQTHLMTLEKLLREVIQEIKGLRKDIGDLTTEISREN